MKELQAEMCEGEADRGLVSHSAFATWCAKDFKCIKDFYLYNMFASFGQLSVKYKCINLLHFQGKLHF